MLHFLSFLCIVNRIWKQLHSVLINILHSIPAFLFANVEVLTLEGSLHILSKNFTLRGSH